MCETLGIPLEIIIDSLYNNEMVIDWVEFFETGLTSLWSYKRILHKIESGLIDNDIDPVPVIQRLKYIYTPSSGRGPESTKLGR